MIPIYETCNWKPSDTTTGTTSYSSRHGNFCRHFVHNESKRKYCVFHLEDELRHNIANFRQDFIDQFNEKLKKELHDSHINTIECVGFSFPRHFDVLSQQSYDKPFDFTFARFEDNFTFMSTTFQRGVKFESCTFNGQSLFLSAEFEGGVDFSNTQFRSNVYFSNCKFSGAALFNEVHFSGDTSFTESTFNTVTHFSRSTIHAAAHFVDIRFEGYTSFDLVEFERLVTFRKCLFLKRTTFGGTSFKNKVVFSSCAAIDADTTQNTGSVMTSFRGALFLQPNMVYFYKTSLSHVLMTDVIDLDKISFWSVEWHKIEGRNALYDETVVTEEPRDYLLIAHAYRQLMKNYDATLDYRTAGDFHIGAMKAEECLLKEKLKPQQTNPRSHLNNQISCLMHDLYRIVSNYGESYGRAIAGLLVSFTVFTSVYWAAFYKETLTSGSDGVDVLISIMKAITLSFQIVTFQKWSISSKSFLVDSWLFHLCASLQVIVTVSLVAVFVLALKRRFRR